MSFQRKLFKSNYSPLRSPVYYIRNKNIPLQNKPTTTSDTTSPLLVGYTVEPYRFHLQEYKAHLLHSIICSGVRIGLSTTFAKLASIPFSRLYTWFDTGR